MKPKAYSYIRFSRPEQIRGNSLARQKEMSDQYCKVNGLVLDTSLSLYDLGISAFKGKNIEEGAALGAFITAIDEGKIEAGSYLLVESLDRLSRQKVVNALHVFLSILRKGIFIVTLSDCYKYDPNDINLEQLIISITIMSRAHEESEIKSKRLLAVNKAKRKNIKNKKISGMCPSWLKLNKDKTEFTKIANKIKTIQYIFELSVSGIGTYSIITKLENENIQPIARSDKWQTSSISKILKGREVLGEFTSNSNDGNETHKNYYPAIISEELFYRVQEGIKERNISGGGRKGNKITNLFQKIIFCGYSIDDNTSGYRCDSTNETIVINNKATKNKKGHTYLQCANKKRSSGKCTECRKLWRLDHFETSFLLFINEVDISSIIDNEDDIKKKINNIKSLLTIESGKSDNINGKIEKIKAAMLSSESTIPTFLLEEGKNLEKENNEIVNNISTLKSNLVSKELEYKDSGGVKEKLAQLIYLMPTMNIEDLQKIRQQISLLLQSIIERIEIYSCGSIITEEYIAKVRKEQGKKSADILVNNEEQSKNICLPYFRVYFKSGTYQHVATDPKDPTRLYLSLIPQSASSMLLGDISSPE